MTTKLFSKSFWPGNRAIRALFMLSMILPMVAVGNLSAEEPGDRGEETNREKPFLGGEKRGRDGDRPGKRGVKTRKKMLEKFDEDGDGKLNEEERKKLQESRRSRQEKREGRREKEERRRPVRGTGPWDRSRGPGGPEGAPDPDRLFSKFDVNGDDMIDRKEFKEAMHSMREMRQRRLGQNGKGLRDGRRENGRFRGERGEREERGRFRPGPPRGPRPGDGPRRPRPASDRPLDDPDRSDP